MAKIIDGKELDTQVYIGEELNRLPAGTIIQGISGPWIRSETRDEQYITQLKTGLSLSTSASTDLYTVFSGTLTISN